MATAAIRATREVVNTRIQRLLGPGSGGPGRNPPGHADGLDVSIAHRAHGAVRAARALWAPVLVLVTPGSLTGNSWLVRGVSVIVGDQGALDRRADGPVVPDRGVEGEQALDDAGP